MIGRIDPEGVETRVVHDLIDFSAKNVLEIGCGDGRLTWRFADAAASVLAFDPRKRLDGRTCHQTLAYSPSHHLSLLHEHQWVRRSLL